MSTRLYIGNLPKEVEKKELEDVFAEFDSTISTKLITDRKTGKCRGFGFVTVKTEEQADQLIEKFNGFMFKDTEIKIERAQPRAKGKEEGEETTTPAPVSTTSAPSKRSSGGGGNNNKSKSRSSSSGGSSDAVQPDPRWAQELEKLKELLAAQAANP
jgi:RNA recognition motif-containing protein